MSPFLPGWHGDRVVEKRTTMKLPAEGTRWLITVRWLACAVVLASAWFTSAVLGVVPHPLPLYLVGLGLFACNAWFWYGRRGWPISEAGLDRDVFLQIVVDLTALTLLLYFSDITRNPFLFFFVFHMIIASIYLHGLLPYVVAGMATTLVGAAFLTEYLSGSPAFAIVLPSDPPGGRTLDGLYLWGVFTALAGTLWITVYFTTSIHRYLDRAHAELRQKEKMLGIGQLVAGIAHQIANPLDGLQNCLHTIGQRVHDDPQLTEYVKLMSDALDRIERTAKRVQAFAQPRGVTLERTDVNAAVQNTLKVLGTAHEPAIKIETDLGNLPSVQGDPYTLQEVLFNLCTNALVAMPGGGTLTVRTIALGRKRKRGGTTMVAIEVSDTGVGIPSQLQEKIFEPFFTTRADSGGTGLGLGLCRMLISEMGGQITVRSAPGHGATFTVMLHPADPHTTPAK